MNMTTKKPVKPNYVLLGIGLALFITSTVSSILTFGESPVAGVLSALAAIAGLVLAVLELRKLFANNSNN